MDIPRFYLIADELRSGCGNQLSGGGAESKLNAAAIWSIALANNRSSRTGRLLIESAGDFGKDIVGVVTDERNRPHHDHYNHRQHHGILGNILTFIVRPHPEQKFFHLADPSFYSSLPANLYRHS